MPKPRVKTLVWISALALVGLGVLSGFIVANGPDREISFVRTVPALADEKALAKSLHNIPNWAEWHHNMKEVKLVDGRGAPYPIMDQTLMEGGLLLFKVEPPTRQWKRFEMRMEIVQYVQGKLLRLRLLDDTSGRITQLFSDVEWKIEILPPGSVELRKEFKGPIVRGTLTARTRHWRARLITAVSERIVMNQLFYPDLPKLAETTRPSELSSPQGQQ